MARDEFSRQVTDRLAKRAGMKCSHPECRMPTSGPDGGDGVTNVGIAAHITAASSGGPRFDENLTSEQRSDISNGIWLCQNHAKLIDDDELTYTNEILRGWKIIAEQIAAVEAHGFTVIKRNPFSTLEQKCPKLLSQMRDDLKQKPLVREFILLSNTWTYNPGRTPYFEYYYEDHEFLPSLMTIMINVGAIHDVTHNRVPRYNFTESFVSYLTGEIH